MKTAFIKILIVVVPFAAAISITILNFGKGNCLDSAQVRAVLSKAKQSEQAGNLQSALLGIISFGLN